MRLTDYTKVVENIFGRYLYDDSPSNRLIMGILTVVLLLFFLGHTEIEDKKLKIKDKFAYIFLALIPLTLVGMLIPPQIIERSSLLSDNYKYTISEEKANVPDKYGVTQTNKDKVVITFEEDPLLPRELTTYASTFDRVFDDKSDENKFIVGTIGKEGITLIDKNSVFEDFLHLDGVTYEYINNNYVIITKEELGQDYYKIVEAMKNVHGENYLNPYQVKYSSEIK